MSDTNIGLVAPVKDGKVEYTASSDSTKKETKGSSELGKDAFLQLLVAQMQYQDPLNPSDNTEYVSQLATFSQLEALQNLNSENEKSQAFSLVGKYVTLKTTDSNGNTTFPEGVVDFVNISAKGVSLSVNGTNYNYDQLLRVEDDNYYLTRNLPGVESEYKLTYNAQFPEDLSFEVNFGNDTQKATEVALIINGVNIDPEHMSYKDSTVTVSKEALANLPNGEYRASLIFNNTELTQVHDKLIITVYNSSAEEVTPPDTV